jgi:hypothetical protein
MANFFNRRLLPASSVAAQLHHPPWLLVFDPE